MKLLEEKYKRLFELVSDAIFLIDAETFMIIEANGAAFELYGYTRDEFLLRPNYDLSAEPAQTRSAVRGRLSSVPIRYHRKKSGEVFPVEINASYFEMEGRKLHIASIRDISMRLRAEADIRESEEKYRLLADSMNDIIWIMDLNLRTTYVSPSVLKVLGFTPEERMRQGSDRLQFLYVVINSITAPMFFKEGRALQELKEIYGNLYPSMLRDLGLAAAVRWYAKHQLEMNKINMSLNLEINESINEEIKVNVYRIIQEIFSNMAKHSGTDSARVSIRLADDNDIFLEVEDNGIGFNADDKAGSGFGLATIRQRCDHIGCLLEITSRPGEGTKFIIKKKSGAPSGINI